MKIFLLLFVLASYIVPQTFAADGGVDNSVGNYTVSMYQVPFAPIVKKSTTITFLVTDKNSGKRLAHLPVQLTVTQTVFSQTGDNSHDKVLLSKQVTTDVNGSIEFSYIFPKDTIYEVGIYFPQIKTGSQDVGFLLEPRSENNLQVLFAVIPLAFIVGLAIGLLFLRRFVRTNS